MISLATCIILNDRNLHWGDSDLNGTDPTSVLPETNLESNPLLVEGLH